MRHILSRMGGFVVFMLSLSLYLGEKYRGKHGSWHQSL